MTVMLWAGRAASAVCLAAVLVGWQPAFWSSCVAYGGLLVQFWTIAYFRAQARGWRAVVQAQNAHRPFVVGEVLDGGHGAPP